MVKTVKSFFADMAIISSTYKIGLSSQCAVSRDARHPPNISFGTELTLNFQTTFELGCR
jgi:hypothetical protein